MSFKPKQTNLNNLKHLEVLDVPMVELVEADQLGESDARAKGAWL